MRAKRVILNKKISQKQVKTKQQGKKRSDVNIDDIVSRLDNVLKRSEIVEKKLNLIENKRREAFPSSSFVHESILKSQNTAHNSTTVNLEDPSPLRYSTELQTTLDVESGNIDTTYVSPFEKRKVKFTRSPTMKQVLLELEELRKDFDAVLSVQKELQSDIRQLKESQRRQRPL